MEQGSWGTLPQAAVQRGVGEQVGMLFELYQNPGVQQQLMLVVVLVSPTLEVVQKQGWMMVEVFVLHLEVLQLQQLVALLGVVALMKARLMECHWRVQGLSCCWGLTLLCQCHLLVVAMAVALPAE
jgi:hypothetical protein